MCGRLRRLRLRRLADFERIDPDRLGDVLELDRAQIAHGEIEPRLDLPIRLLGQTNSAGLGDTLQSGGDIDAVAHQIAVALLDHVAEMDADSELDATLGRKTGIALDHAVLHLDGAANGVNDASKLNEDAITRPLDDATVMHRDRGIEQIAPQPAQPRQRPLLVGTGKLAVSGYVRRQDGRELAGFRHGNTLNQARLAHCPQAQNRSLTKAARSDELSSACVSIIGKSDLPA